MHFKVNHNGCKEKNGMIQLRFDFFLDSGEYKYDSTYYQYPIQSELAKGYPGEVDENGQPTDYNDYKNWFDSLPKEWKHSQFYGHFVYVHPDITDEEILFLGEWISLLAKRNWDKDLDFRTDGEIKNLPVPKVKITQERIDLCESKLTDIKTKTYEKFDITE